MVKTYHVMDYLKDGIADHDVLDEDFKVIHTQYLNETINSFEVEFTDLSSENHDKTKYRITVESID